MTTTMRKQQLPVKVCFTSAHQVALLIVALFICLRTVRSSDPTVIFLSGSGARQLSGGAPSGNGASMPFTIQTIGRGDSVERKSDQSSSSSSSSSGGGGLYSLASVLRERLGERMQDRSSSKKGPRIIVIPASGQSSSPQQSQQQQQAPRVPSYSNYMSASSYPGYVASPYVNAPQYMAAASAPYPQYAFPYASPYMYTLSPSISSSSSASSGRYAAAESAPYASYAHPSATSASLLGSILPSNIGSILKYPYTSLYPYLAQAVAHTLYGASANNQY